MKFNINDDVRVKLTEYGEQVLDKHLNEAYGKEARIIRPYRQDGEYFRFQMWDFMATFGQSIYMGGKQIFVDNELEIV